MNPPDPTTTTFSLLCEEDDSSLNEIKLKVSSQHKSEDDQFIRSLIQKESKSSDYCHGFVCDDYSYKKWFKCDRLDAVNWIFSTREILGFHFRTAYLSLTYFDRFNSKRPIDNGKEWAVQLSSIACLSLAAKMEEQIVPPLSNFQAQQDYTSENSVIQRMELMVLTTLEWRMCCITPFDYIHHFLSLICDEYDECNEFLVSKVIGLILDFSKEVNLMDHRPSVVAAAAVLLACDDQVKRNTLEFKIGVVSSHHSIEKECLYNCYNLLKAIEPKKNNNPELVTYGLSRNRWSRSSNLGTKSSGGSLCIPWI
ncbi:cyclin-D5-1-like [Rutidosis leptorrhynchoides]|uniref:cyclin-D5-1-like n=1 Tax=Rutidosis leptorrhynchoides TaxID=125765 RepID=UPI003A9A4521